MQLDNRLTEFVAAIGEGKFEVMIISTHGIKLDETSVHGNCEIFRTKDG